jgi:general secretion pathway protein G
MTILNKWAARANDIRQSPRTQSRRRGFTLIELLVVILILAILAALIVPRVVGKTSDAKIAAAKTDLSTLSSALANFRLDCDRYPTTEEGLNALRVAPSGVTNWKGPYLEKDVPNDPWQNPYQYQAPGPNGSGYQIESYGSDGAQGGEGDAADIVETGG